MNNLILSLAITTHLGFHGSPEVFHPHVRYTHDDSIAGAFRNSEGSLSAYYGFTRTYGNSAMEYALVTGYDSSPLLPYIRYSYDINNDLSLFITPAVELYETYGVVNENVGLVIGLELKSQQ